jgi:hypothetical protein
VKTLAVLIILLLLGLLTIALWPARYEYRALAVPEAQFRSVMDSLGADGWELVAARKQSTASHSSYEVVLKRRKSFLVSDRHSSNTALAKVLDGKDERNSTTVTAAEPPVTATLRPTPQPIVVVNTPPPASSSTSPVVEVSAQQQFDERLRIAKATGRVFMDSPAGVYHKPTCPSVKPWMRDGFVSVAKLSGLHPAPDCHSK